MPCHSPPLPLSLSLSLSSPLGPSPLVHRQSYDGGTILWLENVPLQASAAGLEAWLTSDDAGSYDMMFQLIGQGDLVVTYGKRHARGKDIAVFDLYRVADGLIVEHWMNEEEIGPRETWGNSGKF